MAVLLSWAAREVSAAEKLRFTCSSASKKQHTPCHIYLAPHDYRRPVLSFDSSTPTTVPAGQYDLRAAAPGFASARNTTLTIGAEETPVFAGVHAIAMELVPGGRVEIPPEIAPAGAAVQILSLATGRLDTIFVDRERVVDFPAGDVIALGFRGPDDALGVTRPWRLSPSQQRSLEPFSVPAKGTAHLLVRVDYPPGAGAVSLRDIKVSAQTGGLATSPAEATNAAVNSHYSFFYGLPIGTYSLAIESHYWRNAGSSSFELGESALTVFDSTLLGLKPSLTVEVGIDESFVAKESLLTVFECPDSQLGPGTAAWPDLHQCVSRAEKQFSGSTTFPFLEARQYFLRLETGPQRLGRHTDLRSGSDRTERLEVRSHRVQGQVRRGGEGVPAELGFENLDTSVREPTVLSSPDGSFEATVWSTGLYKVLIHVIGDSPETALPFLCKVVSEDSRQDFSIPKTRVIVDVRDRLTTQPIAGASVLWQAATGTEELQADATGRVELPPPAPGKLALWCNAEGYERANQSFEVVDTSSPQRFVLSLRRVRDENSFTVVLPSGSPAAGAHVLSSTGIRSECDSAGLCRFADRPADGTIFLIVHPDLGLTIVAAEHALTEGQVVGQVRGGPLAVEVDRGPTTASAVLAASVVIQGVPISSYDLETIGNLLGQPFRLYVYPGAAQQSFLIPGLPFGDVLVSVAASQGQSRAAASGHAVGQFPLRLPTSGERVRLP